MKIAYFSVYRDGTGYSKAALGNILAADAAGIDVVCRPISMTPPRGGVPPRIGKLEAGDLHCVDTVVQHCLPSTFEYRGGVRNIGVFAWETTHFRGSGWAGRCNLMDEVWVSCRQSRQAALDSGVKVPVRVVPYACDASRFDREPEKLPVPELDGKCVFYFVGEMNARKNLTGLLRAYLSEFSGRDDVALVLKAHTPGLSPEDSEKAVEHLVSGVKRAMHNRRPERDPKLVVFTDFWPDATIDRLHATGDVFVSASHGESWCLPAHDAMGFGNPVIAPNWGAFPDLLYAQSDPYFRPETQTFRHPGEIPTGWLAPGHLTNCFGMETAGPELYTGCEAWFDPSPTEFGALMRAAYCEWKSGTLKDRGKAAAERAREFDLKRVGEVIKKALGG